MYRIASLILTTTVLALASALLKKVTFNITVETEGIPLGGDIKFPGDVGHAIWNGLEKLTKKPQV